MAFPSHFIIPAKARLLLAFVLLFVLRTALALTSLLDLNSILRHQNLPAHRKRGFGPWLTAFWTR